MKKTKKLNEEMHGWNWTTQIEYDKNEGREGGPCILNIEREHSQRH